MRSTTSSRTALSTRSSSAGARPPSTPPPSAARSSRSSTSLPRTALPNDVPRLADRVREYSDAGCLVTLDRLVEGIQGGTGQSFNLEVAASLSSRGVPFLLAGGLTPANVGRAISIVRPWGVDVSSGVETIGRKDRRKIHRFVENARHADAALSGSA